MSIVFSRNQFARNRSQNESNTTKTDAQSYMIISSLIFETADVTGVGSNLLWQKKKTEIHANCLYQQI